MTTLAVANLDFSKRYDPDQPRSELRRLFLIERRHTIKEAAADLGTSGELMRQFVCGQRDLPAKYLGPLYLALGRRLSIITAVLQGTDLIIGQRIPASIHHCPPRLLERMMVLFGDIYQIFGKLVRGEKLTPEELRDLKGEVAELQQVLSEVIETAEQQTEGK